MVAASDQEMVMDAVFFSFLDALGELVQNSQFLHLIRQTIVSLNHGWALHELSFSLAYTIMGFPEL